MSLSAGETGCSSALLLESGLGVVDVCLVDGQDQLTLASFLVEIHPQDLVLRKGHLVE